MAETSYGDERRLAFLGAVLADAGSARVLDVGCGTGMRLTRPLAEAFPCCRFTGVDADAASIAWARENVRDLANLSFRLPGEVPPDDRFDLIIASEVIEHVADPPQFLAELRGRLAADGRIVLTLPNGYGPFEMMALTECLLHLSGVQALLRRLKYALRGRTAPPPIAERDTLAISPHVNFFSYGELRRLCETVGLVATRTANRCILCGYILDDVIRGTRLAELNARLADRLPRWCVSDWMLELAAARPAMPARWHRGAWARFRKRLNERRWGIA